ncbi:MAG: hypothetical protein FJ254_10015 [Phycisphaerae bacterium]|nr:hypothetical protein [Phycisphaerae bacterium]
MPASTRPQLAALADGAASSAATLFARALGSQLRAPFITLGFMALLTIPSLKLGDRGLFDGERFRFVDHCAHRPQADSSNPRSAPLTVPSPLRSPTMVPCCPELAQFDSTTPRSTPSTDPFPLRSATQPHGTLELPALVHEGACTICTRSNSAADTPTVVMRRATSPDGATNIGASMGPNHAVEDLPASDEIAPTFCQEPSWSRRARCVVALPGVMDSTASQSTPRSWHSSGS